ncbi:AAA family ATPase [Terrimonas pollutisoli]|uniref:AAA family ATPase n=1 Tax=Terrimonas pollutisoli TaxID=3034147 RepID=UPI0023EDD701|nr:ATP-binding protein [Terrimonas sp. H1YJ31]
MKDSPFIYGSTVSTHSFTNREVEAAKLRSNLVSGINTMIISPRRWGKSSLVEKVINDIKKKEKKTKTVIIDLFSVSNEQEFLESFAREVIKASSSRWQEWMTSGKDFFKKLLPKLSLGMDPATDFSLSFDWKELKKNSDEVLNLPETIAQNKGIKMIVCLDEFQNLSSFTDYPDFEKKMRAAWQRQKSVTYCLFGSKRHMMTDIFNNPSKPFYRFGDIMLLQKIEMKKWVTFICESFAVSGKQIDKTEASKIPLLMKNHSWYVQQMAHYTWNLTQKKAGASEIETALKELINANSPLYQKEIETISTTQLNLLKAVAKNETRFTSAAVMQTHQLGTPRNVSKNKILLINNDLIHEVNGQFEFVDPAFELWFKKQFFNQSYFI